MSKWGSLAFLCGIFVTYTIDRSLLGILAVPIQTELGISDIKFGLLSSGIFWTYSLAVPLAGIAGDFFDRRKLIGFAAITWSLMTFFAGFANGFWSLFLLVSIAIVIPQTLYGPAANAYIASIHRDTRTVAMSVHQGAYYTGWFVSGAIAAFIMQLFGGWRSVFMVAGLVGMIIGGVFFFCTKSKRSETQGAIRVKPSFVKALKAYFGCPSAMLISVCYVAQVFVGFGYSAWGPKFVAKKFELSSSTAGTGTMFWHYVAALAAIVLAGFLTDVAIRKYPRFRLVLSILAALIAAPALLLFAKGGTLSVTWMAAAILGAAIGTIGANQFTSLFDVIPTEYRASAVGFLNVIAGLIGSTSPIVLGWFSDAHGVNGFERGFMCFAGAEILAVMALICAFAFTYNKNRVAEI